jgi:hypothetical protein
MTQTKQREDTYQPERGLLSYREVAEIERAVAHILRQHGFPVDAGAVGGMVWHHVHLWLVLTT